MSTKPLGRKSYGSIGHVKGSRVGPSDRTLPDGQCAIAMERTRDNHDFVICQEKLDGSNVGVAKLNGGIIPITRSGYIANTSPHKMHHVYHSWVIKNYNRFNSILCNGERICGEWLYQAHGTIYELPHEPFVAFDIFDKNNKRILHDELLNRCMKSGITTPKVVSNGPPISIEDGIKAIGKSGFYGAKDLPEGLVWRVERKGEVDFLCKYVRPEKEDGKYLFGEPVYNKFKGEL